jgi:uncharacterized protein (DUF58 family)
MLTERGQATIALGIGLYIVAWGFGTRELFAVAIGLIAAPLLAGAWLRLLVRPMSLRRRTGDRELVEGGRVPVALEVRPDGGPLPARAVVVDRIAGEESTEVAMRRIGHQLRGRYAIEHVPRGRYALEGAELVLDDPFGLTEARIPLPRRDTLLVYPRVFELEGVFTDDGGAGGGAGRALLHRTAGYDLHSIRDFQQGESLRRVHWRSTAKRRKLMVKELTDMPRDEAAVLLDGDRRAVVGRRGETSFDAQVRAAASLLARMVTLGQRCSLVIHGASRQRIRVHAGGGEWLTLLAALAAVQADAEHPLHHMLRDVTGGTGAATSVDAARLFVVTAAVSPALADRLLALRSASRDVALVWVDAPTFAGRRTQPGPEEAASLRLAQSGVPVARLRQGDDVGAVLSAAAARGAVGAHA